MHNSGGQEKSCKGISNIYTWLIQGAKFHFNLSETMAAVQKFFTQTNQQTDQSYGGSNTPPSTFP